MDNYIEQYKKLHKQGIYGTSSEKLYDDILPLIQEINPESVLDYGCGQSKLIDKLPAENKYRYDPAIPKYSRLPEYQNIDLVICTDVLEHIPEAEIFGTLSRLFMYSKKVIFAIAIVPAQKQLPNGANAHCTVKSIDWWTKQISKVFGKVSLIKIDRNVKFICKTW